MMATITCNDSHSASASGSGYDCGCDCEGDGEDGGGGGGGGGDDDPCSANGVLMWKCGIVELQNYMDSRTRILWPEQEQRAKSKEAPFASSLLSFVFCLPWSQTLQS